MKPSSKSSSVSKKEQRIITIRLLSETFLLFVLFAYLANLLGSQLGEAKLVLSAYAIILMIQDEVLNLINI